MLVAAALLPLLAFGAWSLATLNRVTQESVATGNLRLVEHEAEHIRHTISEAVTTLQSLAMDLEETTETDQQELLLEDAAARFRAFRELALIDANNRLVVASRADSTLSAVRSDAGTSVDGVLMAPIRVDEHGTPSTLLSLPLEMKRHPHSRLIAAMSLDELGRLVEQIHVGAHGAAILVQADGQVIVAGSNVRRSDTGRNAALSHALSADADVKANPPRVEPGASPASRLGAWSRQYTDERGISQFATAAPIGGLGWSLLIEQPADEAFAAARGLGRYLALAALAAILFVGTAAALVRRRAMAPLVRLEEATQALAAGQFDARVPTEAAGEFTRLATSFNAMAERLASLQDRIKSQERQVMFGRVVAGMFHDLSHPIEAIANNARLLVEHTLDADERDAIGRTIERERATLQRFLDDVLNVARPRPLERFPVDVNASVGDVIDAMRAEADRVQVMLAGHFASGAPTIDGDRFALGRVCRNLIANALQATGPGGHVSVTTVQTSDAIEIEVVDTGVGIPPDRLSTVFDDFVTTKKRGLGLGLATSRRIVEQLGGSIRVSSEVGRGSTFTLHFPRSAARAAAAAI
jgi:signal transduction histidine kinase